MLPVILQLLEGQEGGYLDISSFLDGTIDGVDRGPGPFLQQLLDHLPSTNTVTGTASDTQFTVQHRAQQPGMDIMCF